MGIMLAQDTLGDAQAAKQSLLIFAASASLCAMLAHPAICNGRFELESVSLYSFVP
jgi:hypothetical protein